MERYHEDVCFFFCSINAHTKNNLMYPLKKYSLLLLVLFITYFTNAQTCQSGSTGATPGEDFVLIWADEFDVDGAICSENWFHQTQLPAGGNWYNGEVQHYTDKQDNAFVKDGILSIVAKKETYTNQGVTKNYTSARLNSKIAFTYGKVEVKAKLPTGVGTWPAIWMLGKNINEDGGYWDNQFGTTNWPACGEIDIMEHWGTNQNFVQSAMHTPSSYGGTVNHGGQNIPTASTAFHIYSLEWTPEKMVFAVDGNVHYTYNPGTKDANTWPFDKEQYLLLNIAIEPGIAASFTESAMEIDYVRIFQKESYPTTASTPTEAAPTPGSRSTSDVISIFSDAYADVSGTDFNPDWGQSTRVTTEDIGGNATLKYANFNYQGTNLGTNLDVSEMEFLHVDMWTSDATVVKVSPVSAVGTPIENLVALTPIVSGAWKGYDIPLSDFTANGMVLNDIMQLKVDGQDGVSPSTIYLDNIYFYKSASASPEPTTSAIPPTALADKVVSLFSEAYTDRIVDTWRAAWSVGTLEDVTIDGNEMKKYSDVDYVGVEMVSQPIDASEMTHLHLDIWTADATQIGIKLVDFGADGLFGGGDDAEHQLDFVGPKQGEWIGYDLPLADFTNLTSMSHIAQIVLIGQPSGTSTLFVDNVYFSNANEETTSILSAEPFNQPIFRFDNGVLHVDFGHNREVLGYMVYDLSGKSIIENQAYNLSTTTLNISGLKAGVHILRIITSQGVITRKLLF